MNYFYSINVWIVIWSPYWGTIFKIAMCTYVRSKSLYTCGCPKMVQNARNKANHSNQVRIYSGDLVNLPVTIYFQHFRFLHFCIMHCMQCIYKPIGAKACKRSLNSVFTFLIEFQQACFCKSTHFNAMKFNFDSKKW